MNDYLYVRNWAELQHYTKRNPPWIKLYRRVLRDGDFLRLDEFEQWQLVRIWLASAEEHPGGWVPNNQSWLRRYTGTLRAIPVEKFVEQGWLETRSASDHASAVASKGASTDAIKHVAKHPPKLPPRETETQRRPKNTQASRQSQPEDRNGLPAIDLVLKEITP